MLYGVEACSGVGEYAITFIVFISVEYDLDGDKLCSQNGVCFVMDRGVYIGGGGRGGVDNCNPYSRLALFKGSV